MGHGCRGKRPHRNLTSTFRKTTDEIIDTEGHRRLVERKKTICGSLYKAGRLPPHLLSALDDFVGAVADAMGVATRDFDHSTARLISSYDGISVQAHAFGSRTLSDRQINANTQVRWILERIPPEMQNLLAMIVEEEVGLLAEKPLTLAQLGEQRGYNHKQASASGSTQVFDVLSVLAQLRRDFLRAHPKNPKKGNRKTPNETRLGR